jgi:K+-transporting ATPase KdpF subunit
VEHGFYLYRRAGLVQRCDVGVHRRLQQAGGHAMNLMQIIGLAVAVGLLVYLLVALIKPEVF